MIQTKRGFTLLEILLVIAIIAILAAIVIIAINPAKQLAQSRNTQRRADVNTVLNGVYQYSIDNSGAIPTIPTGACSLVAANQICKAGATGTCATGVDLSVLTASQKYLTSIPIDPTVSSTDGTGYYISKSATNNRITICAPSAESEAGTTPTITVTR